jgi:hypothetical protein
VTAVKVKQQETKLRTREWPQRKKSTVEVEGRWGSKIAATGMPRNKRPTIRRWRREWTARKRWESLTEMRTTHKMLPLISERREVTSGEEAEQESTKDEGGDTDAKGEEEDA